MKLRSLAAPRRVGLVACATLALAALPAGDFTAPWLLAFSLPAAIALWTARLPVRAIENLALAATLQIAAVWLTLHYAGPLPHLAALGGTLLPPMVFLTLRAEALDVLRAVFLSFCVMLVGAILGDPSLLQVLGFLVAAVATLQVDVAISAGEDRASWRGCRPGIAARARGATTIALAALAACLTTFQLLRALPTPSRAEPAPMASASRDRSAGPGSDFDFGNVPGSLISLRTDRLLTVRPADGRPMPADLYLRCAHFDVAGLDRWDTRAARYTPVPVDAGIARVQRSVAGVPVRWLSIEVLEPEPGFAYVPPGTFAIANAPPLLGDRGQGVFRFAATPPAGTNYAVAFQTHREDQIDALPNGRGQARLTEIGDDLRPWLATFDEILARPRVQRAGLEPMRIAAAIAAELAAQCRYALREPKGPYRHSLLNFLDGDREGFCMHFASVTAICLRRAGIPARIAAGLYRGDPDPGEDSARTFGSHHAHAWVEIPFEDLGWVVFDPTPPAARENLRWIDFDAPEQQDPAADVASSAPRERRAVREFGDGFLLILGSAAAVVVLALRRSQRLSRAPVAAPTSKEARTARKLLERVLATLARRGHPRLCDETLERYAARLCAAGIGGTALRDAFAAYQEVRFGGRPFDAPRRTRLTPDTAVFEGA